METQNSSSSNILSPGSSTVPEMNPIEEELESDYTALTSGYLQGLKTKRKQLKEKKKKAKTKAENSKESKIFVLLTINLVLSFELPPKNIFFQYKRGEHIHNVMQQVQSNENRT